MGGGPRGVGGWCQIPPPLPGDAELLRKTQLGPPRSHRHMRRHLGQYTQMWLQSTLLFMERFRISVSAGCTREGPDLHSARPLPLGRVVPHGARKGQRLGQVSRPELQSNVYRSQRGTRPLGHFPQRHRTTRISSRGLLLTLSTGGGGGRPIPDPLQEGRGQGCIRRGGGGGGWAVKGGGRVGWDPPSSQGPPVVPAERGPNNFEA